MYSEGHTCTRPQEHMYTMPAGAHTCASTHAHMYLGTCLQRNENQPHSLLHVTEGPLVKLNQHLPSLMQLPSLMKLLYNN